MGFLDDLGKKVADAGQKTVQKTKEISDVARINSLINQEESKINNTYYQIGKLYVSIHGNDREEEFVSLVSAVSEMENNVREYRKQIQEVKGVQRCANCGAEVPRGIAFCSSCGTPMPNADTSAEDTLRCVNCGAVVKKGMRFCTSCGKPMIQESEIAEKLPESASQEMSSGILEKTCSNCGAKLESDAIFCIECGSKV